MITTWLIVTCRGMDEQVRRTLLDTTAQGFNAHYYESTPWLEYDTNADGPVPTIQLYCQSQSEATRLRKKLRDACSSYVKHFPHPRDPAKHCRDHPLDGRIFFRYVDDDGNDLAPEQLPKRVAG